MQIQSIKIKNYRGIKEAEVKFGSFNSIIGKNDTGKTSILSAIASFFDMKNYPITVNDFNDSKLPIEIELELYEDALREKLMECFKSKVKKDAGLEDYVESFIHSNNLKYRKTINYGQNKFDEESILCTDFEREDLRSLYLKSDDAINQILEAYNISVPVKGKGRNSKFEKIGEIKKKFINEKLINFWVNDEYKIRGMLPGVEFFKADYGLEADTKFKSQSVTEIVSYFEKELNQEASKLKAIEAEIFDEMQNEALAIKDFMKDYAANLEAIEIKPSLSWKDIVKSVDVSFKFDNDEKMIPMTHKGAGYRRIFMVARFRYLAEKYHKNSITYLIEEPETFLHPAAQYDLIEAFKELSESNQIFITTHSPVFTGSTSLDSVILCTKTNQSNYEYKNELNEETFLKKVIGELGIKPSYNLMDEHEKIVFVESHNDAKFYDCICKTLGLGNLLKNPKILVLPFGGGEDIDSFLNIDYFSNSNRKLVLIIDCDLQNGEDKKIKQTARVESFISRKDRATGYVLKKSCIENYYHPKAFERFLSTLGATGHTFNFFDENTNVKQFIKNFIESNDLRGLPLKHKNNFEIFQMTTAEEWNEVLEPELVQFLKEILEI